MFVHVPLQNVNIVLHVALATSDAAIEYDHVPRSFYQHQSSFLSGFTKVGFETSEKFTLSVSDVDPEIYYYPCKCVTTLGFKRWSVSPAFTPFFTWKGVLCAIR